jgi:hypothetical protein
LTELLGLQRQLLFMEDAPGREVIEMDEWGPVEKTAQCCVIRKP